MKRSAAYLPAVLAIAIAASGCSGATRSLPPVPAAGGRSTAAAAPDGQNRLPVTVRFKIPGRHRGHRAHYLSPSTGSIVLAVFNAHHTKRLLKTELDTVPGLNGCTPVTNGTFTCPMTLKLQPTTYAFDVMTYDAFGAKGTQLAALKDYVKTIVPGKADSIHLTLYGIPVQIDYGFVGTSKFVNGNTTSTFDIAGVGSGAAQQFQLATEDADGNIIVGSGSPTYAMETNEPTNVTIAKVNGSNGLFKITPLHHTTVAMNLTMEAIPGGGVANPIYASATLGIDQIVYADSSGSGTVEAYAPWSASPILTYPKSLVMNPYTVAVDASGNLYIADFQVTGYLWVFPPGSTTPARTITGLVAPAFGMAIDSTGDIFVTEYLTKDVKEFTPSGGSTPSRTLSASTSPTGINTPAGLALDASGNLYVANNAGTIGVSVYAPGTSTTPSFVITNGVSKPAQLTFDASGNLYVSNNGSNTVTEYAPPFSSSSTPVHTFSSADTATPFAVAVDASKNVWVGQAATGGATQAHVVEFNSSGSVIRNVSGYPQPVYAIAIDQNGNAFVTDNGNGAIDIFSPSSGNAPSGGYPGIPQPTDVVVW